MPKKTDPPKFEFHIKIGSLSMPGDKANYCSCKIKRTAIGTFAQTCEYLVRSRLMVTIFQDGEEELIFPKDKLRRITAIADIQKLTIDTDEISFGLSFLESDVDIETFIAFKGHDLMIEVEHLGDAGAEQMHDDAEGQGMLDQVASDEQPEDMQD